MADRNNDTLFIKQLLSSISANLHVAQLARVTSLSADKTRCAVQPLAHNLSGGKRAMLLSVVVGRCARQYISVGSVVVVGFLDRSLESWDGTGADYDISSSRMHDLNDAVIWEVIT